MRVFGVAAIGLLALLVACECFAEPISTAPAGENSQLGERGKFRLPKLFDFANYKQLFGKHYGSLMEELNRRRLFVARALSAFVSGIKYKYRQRSHYESVNQLSDFSQSELDSMRNKVKAGREGARPLADGPKFLPRANENVEQELEQLVRAHAIQSAGFKELRELLQGGSRREKRDLAKPPPAKLAPPRELPPLINGGQEKRPRRVSEKLTNSRPKSNNPNYEHTDLASFGLVDQQEPVRWFLMRGDLHEQSLSEQLYLSLANLADDPEELKTVLEEEADLPDQMFFDHRQSGCLFEPRSQGTCGSCYAFASISVMEWLHCTQTGKLVAFSEQYMIDCGKGRYGDDGDDLNGCEGALDPAVAHFIHNFGMELRSDYPYAMREQQCPYDEDYDLKKTGYIRMEFTGGVQVAQQHWEQIIEHQPFLIGLNTPESFERYGGGIDEGAQCSDSADHQMVLAGHGREDGLEFWLIRNSYGPNWGEQGYYKLAKAATRKCLQEDAFVLASSDGRTHDVAIKRANVD